MTSNPSDWRELGVRVVRHDQLDPGTPQTPGMPGGPGSGGHRLVTGMFVHGHTDESRQAVSRALDAVLAAVAAHGD